MKTIQEYLSQLFERFKYHKLPIPSNESLSMTDNSISFNVSGPRDSVAIYRLWGPGIVNVWFGKFNDDSGGLGLQGSLDNENNQLEQLLKLHQRFYGSGRRKILSNFTDKMFHRR